MNILIIDDDEVISQLFYLWLQSDELSKYNITPFSVASCEKGVALAKEHSMDIVLMDVNLQGINGIEGTKLFKKLFPHVMVCAISSSHEHELQEQMLQAGAYDYLLKPLIFPIFLKRVKNYIRVLELRKKPRELKDTTLFETHTYNFHIHFPISNEDDLLEFWDFLFSRFNYTKDICNIHDITTHICNFGLTQIEFHNLKSIRIEESDEALFITMQLLQFPQEDDVILFLNYFDEDNYKVQNSIISLKLDKSDSNTKSDEKREVESENRDEQADLELKTATTTQVFSVLDADDFDDFEQEIFKISSTLSHLDQHYNVDEIATLYVSFNSIISILSRYPQFDVMNGCIISLVSILKNGVHNSENWSLIYLLVNSYINDFITWYTLLFIEGASSIDFMDDSLVANVKAIEAMFLDDNREEDVESLDEIFDFVI